MALIDRKIPILTGINDTPSTTGQPNHPNASLLCKNYNDLIDEELKDLQLGRDNRPYVFYLEIFVNATTGNDTTGDGTLALPYATIQRAIDHYCDTNLTANCYITIAGDFIDPVIDLSRAKGIVASGVYDGFGALSMEDQSHYAMIQIIDTPANPATITYTNNYDAINYSSTESPRCHIYSPNDYVGIRDITFNITGSDPMQFNSTKVSFIDCTFNHTADPDYYSSGLLAITHSNLDFLNCTFNHDSSKCYTAMTAYRSMIYLKQVEVNDSHSTNDFARLGEFVDSRLVIGGITTTDTALQTVTTRRNIIFTNYADGTALQTATGIDPARNLVHYSGTAL